MTKFQGHDIDHRHYKAPRTCEGYYGESRNNDHIVGRWSLAIVIVLLLLYAVGINL